MRVVAVDTIDRVDVDRRGAAARVVIVLRDGEIVPLAIGRSSGGQHAATAEALRRMLGLVR